MANISLVRHEAACVALKESPPERASSSGAYREGNESQTEAQSASLATHPGLLAVRQSPGVVLLGYGQETQSIQIVSITTKSGPM